MTLLKSKLTTVARRFGLVWLAGATVLMVGGAAGGLAVGAEDPACALTPAERVHVASVIDGDTVVLADGSEVRLVGIQAPKLALGRKGFRTWPLADEAKRALEAIALGRDGELRYGGLREDRHGRRLAHLFIDGQAGDGDAGPVWAQSAMLERGLARTYSFADNRSCVDQLLARERAARAAGRGIWPLGYYALREAGDEEGLEALEGSFQIVEGLVEDVAVVNRRIYLNFGQNYLHDFTISIGPRDARLFSIEDLRALRGETVRVRGWIAVLNGPMIEASHPEQIERLEVSR